MSKESLYFDAVSHIYVEKQAEDHPVTREILMRFPKAQVIMIRHYKDVFNRRKQDYRTQNRSKSLILAINNGTRIFEGSDMCQKHGSSRVFYASNVMNCIFDCDYCFLKGMYSTSNILFFVNFEDYREDVKKLLSEGPLSLSVSYETDLPAVRGIYDMNRLWCEFAALSPDLTLEIRTKSNYTGDIKADNIIYSYTLSPTEIIDRFEHHTATLQQRIRAVNDGISRGLNIRLCFDPLIYVSDFKRCYNNFMDEVIARIPFDKVYDVSIGAFRISGEYLKGLRRCAPLSAATEFSFVNDNGYRVYPAEIRSEMRDLVRNRLKEVTCERKIYCDSDGGIFGDR